MLPVSSTQGESVADAARNRKVNNVLIAIVGAAGVMVGPALMAGFAFWAVFLGTGLIISGGGILPFSALLAAVLVRLVHRERGPR